MKKPNFARWSVAEIRDYLCLQEELPFPALTALKRDKRKGVQKLLLAFLQRREKGLAEKNRVHSMFQMEKPIHESGYKLVAGVDEAGRGPLAGPVVAAAVILEPEAENFWVELSEINDSKQLPPYKRERLYEAITANARSFAVGAVSAPLIDRINIYQASLEAMRLAVKQLYPQPCFLLSDAFTVPGLDIPQQAVKHGDALYLSIAAASIIAKVTRDRIMESYDPVYPGYGFARHKGYPTPEHKTAIRALGVSPIHRRTFKHD